jgi:hypothetical protein
MGALQTRHRSDDVVFWSDFFLSFMKAPGFASHDTSARFEAYSDELDNAKGLDLTELGGIVKVPKSSVTGAIIDQRGEPANRPKRFNWRKITPVSVTLT